MRSRSSTISRIEALDPRQRREQRELWREAVKDEDKPEKGLGTRIAERFRGLELDAPLEELRGYTIEPPKFDD